MSADDATTVAAAPRPPSHVWRKLAAVLLVMGGVTIGIIGLGLTTDGRWWGVALIAAAPAGIYAATRITPEGGTTGYFDENI